MARFVELLPQAVLGYRTPSQEILEPQKNPYLQIGAVDFSQLLFPVYVRSRNFSLRRHPEKSPDGALLSDVILGMAGAAGIGIATALLLHQMPQHDVAAGLLAGVGTKFTYNLGANMVMNARHRV